MLKLIWMFDCAGYSGLKNIRNMKHASDSTEQQTAETYMLQELSKKLGVELQSKKLQLPTGNAVQIDGLNEENKVLCEIYARIGKLKGSQPDKVASDFLKMLFVEKTFGHKWDKHFCFASDEAASLVQGNSWLAQTAKEMDITIHVIMPDVNIINSIVEAQKRQVMINKNN